MQIYGIELAFAIIDKDKIITNSFREKKET